MSRRSLSAQSGMTLIEVIVSMTLMTIVFGGVLTVFDGATRSAARTDEHNAQQDKARLTVDRLSRELRNLASPSDFSGPGGMRPEAVDRNGMYDLIFKTVDGDNGPTPTNQAGVKRVRYCLDSSTPDNGRIVMQQQTSATYTAVAPADEACPGTGWTSTRTVADHVSNRAGGQERAMFVYSTDATLLPYDVPSAMDDTTRVETRLWIDGKPAFRPTETRLSSAVLLRNQNRPPTAVARVNVSGTTVHLNGSESTDPEQETLKYRWYLGTDTSAPLTDGQEWPKEGVFVTVPNLPAGTHTFTLKVVDSADLEAVSEPQTVKVEVS